MGTFGITDFDSSKALCKDGTIDKNNPSNPCVNNGGVNWGGGAKSNIDWIKSSKEYLGSTTQTKVLCKDGTFGFDISSSNAKYDNSKTCMNNGGRAENQPVIKQLQSKEEVANRMNEEIAKIKFPLKTTVITSAVPLGLAYYSYYNNYSLTKGIGVVVIGSVVAFYGAIIFSGKGGFV
jgi:hypothetical protein